jgi:hypothetical protein
MPEDQQPAGPAAVSLPRSVPYRVINARHECYDGEYLRRLKALYKGGRALLRNQRLLEEIFPRHRDELDSVYRQRCKRVFYVPYAGEILNFISASMAADPLQVERKPPQGSSQAPALDEWWAKFSTDVSPPGGKTCSLRDYVKDAVLDALQVRVSWHRVDMPKPGQFASQGEQDRAGARDAYVVPVEAEMVIDWEEDESGELIILVTYARECKRKTLEQGRDTVTEVWRVYTREEWARYELTHKKDEEVKDDYPVAMADGGPHEFKRVPFVRLELPDGLWAMDNIEGLCREHFNKRSALGWAELQSLLPELYEFLGPEEAVGATVIGANQGDAERAKRQRRGQGFVQTRGKDDRAEFVGPDSAPFSEARKSCDDLRTEIHRVTHQMALAVDNSAAALRRSADSKGQDKASAMVVFEALGQLARKFAEDICDMVARGRGEEALVKQWQAKGMANFDAVSVDAEIDRDVNLETISIPSPTFQRWRKLNLAKLRMGEDATPELLEAIKDELEENITAESFDVSAMERKPMELGGDEEDDAKNGGEDKGDGEKKEPGDDPGKE